MGGGEGGGSAHLHVVNFLRCLCFSSIWYLELWKACLHGLVQNLSTCKNAAKHLKWENESVKSLTSRECHQTLQCSKVLFLRCTWVSTSKEGVVTDPALACTKLLTLHCAGCKPGRQCNAACGPNSVDCQACRMTRPAGMLRTDPKKKRLS